jgi:hypothetical protein
MERHEPVRIRSAEKERRGGSGGTGQPIFRRGGVFGGGDDASNELLTLTFGEVEDRVEGAPEPTKVETERGGERLSVCSYQIC